MKRHCRRCLFEEAMPLWLIPEHLPAALLPITVNHHGLCNVCEVYLRDIDEGLLADEADQLAFDVAASGRPALLALSGGKDSLATLAVCRARDIDVVAVLYDNGFVPAPVIARARAVCDAVSVPFSVIVADPDDARAIAAAVASPSPSSPAPCMACARQMGRHFAAWCDRLEASWIVSGTNYPAHWQHSDHTGHDDGQRWRIQASHGLLSPTGRTLRLIHLPYALRLTHDDVRAALGGLGVDLDEVTRAVGGISSNCRVPGLVQGPVARAIGHVPEHEDLALEVLSGHRRREDAIAELRLKAPGLVTIGR